MVQNAGVPPHQEQQRRPKSDAGGIDGEVNEGVSAALKVLNPVQGHAHSCRGSNENKPSIDVVSHALRACLAAQL